MNTKKQLNIMVLSGGPSPEREVSLASGQAVARALQQVGHNVQTSDISPENLQALNCPKIDLFMPMLHGTFGEDGQLQTIMEKKKLKFAFSNAKSSALAMQKYNSKQIFAKYGLYTAPSHLILPRQLNETDLIEAKIIDLGLPCVVKPDCQGSSVGISIVNDINQAVIAVKEVLIQYGDCIIEKFIAGEEYTVGVLLDSPLPVLQVKVSEGFYDYKAKYQSGTTKYILDPDISLRQSQAMQAAALCAFGALGCRDLARVDFILADRKPYILEINTIPGFTDHSLVPKAAGHMGMSMMEICDKIAQNAYFRSM